MFPRRRAAPKETPQRGWLRHSLESVPALRRRVSHEPGRLSDDQVQNSNVICSSSKVMKVGSPATSSGMMLKRASLPMR
jgi:hypothetical protein